MCDIDSMQFVHAKERLANMAVDPVGNYRKKAAEEAAKAAEEAAQNDPNYRAKSAAAAAKASQKSHPNPQQASQQKSQPSPQSGLQQKPSRDNSFYDKKLDKSIPKGYDRDRKLNIDFIF